MKTLLVLAVLTTLASCGEKKKDQSREDKLVSKYQAQILNPERGLVAYENTLGEDLIYVLKDGSEDTTEIREVKEKRYSVILSISDNKIFQYQETTDFISGNKDKRIFVIEPSLSELKETFREGKVVNDILVSTMEQTDKFGSKSYETLLEYETNLLKPYCDFRWRKTYNKVEIPNGTKTVDHHSISTCGEILTPDELKKIDLKSITFCDLEGDCVENEDMSYLTSDL